MNKLATILMTSPGVGFGPKIRRFLLQEYNCSLGNSVPASRDTPDLCFDFPDAKHIIPMFGYPESWDRLLQTWDEWKEFTEKQ